MKAKEELLGNSLGTYFSDCNKFRGKEKVSKFEGFN